MLRENEMIEALPVGAFSDSLILGVGQVGSLHAHNFCQLVELLLDSVDSSVLNNIHNYVLEVKVKTEDFIERNL